ncbi:alpha/beta hydrolase [Alkalibacillus haloalkaliphilus]|uniref:Phospholipase n=1 Tax=Alkalibacillus haloalkaliphilus TaxID=94136 RepID=A0A511W7B5_9BACI|nr:alpha/beta hydrolase [Alkalibacillus haloalkaliphilus]GEN46975.1 phospholipase [Alkalibacillus haloalkaliphilus]
MLVRESENPKAVIVLIHGAFEHSGRYEWLVNQLNHNGYHVVYGDLPGQGTNKGKKGFIKSFDDYIVTAEKWINHALTYELPVFMLGHSMGGLTTIRALQEKQYPIKGVILSSPALGIHNVPEKPLYLISKMLNYILPTILFKTNIHSEMATRNDAFYARDLSDPLYLRKVSVRWYHEFENAINEAFDKINDYPEVPTLILQAGEDLLVPVENVESWYEKLSIQDKEIKIWENLYHEVFNEPERDEVLSQALHFLNTHLVEEKQEG